MPNNINLRVIYALLLAAFPIVAQAETYGENQEIYTATLPTVKVEAQADSNILKGYINYDEATVTRNGQLVKETPQSIDTLNIQKTKTTAPTI